MSPDLQRDTNEGDWAAASTAELSGVPSSLDELLRRNRPSIETYIRRRARTRDDADDLVQNVCLKAARHFTEFRGDCPFSSWFLRIAVNEVKNYYRTLAGDRCDGIDDFDLENTAGLQQFAKDPCPNQGVEDRQAVERILAAIDLVCSPDERNVILMIYQGETFEEAADLLGMKSATARSHFLRGRSRLLAHLVAHEPHSVGGTEAIHKAIEAATSSGVEKERLEPAERRALDAGDDRSSAFRSACLKLARHLPFACLFLFTPVIAWMR